MDDIDKPTRRLSSFGSVDEVMEWIRHHQCGNDRKEIEAAWRARHATLNDSLIRNYRMMVEKRLGKKRVILEKQYDQRK